MWHNLYVKAPSDKWMDDKQRPNNLLISYSFMLMWGSNVQCSSATHVNRLNALNTLMIIPPITTFYLWMTDNTKNKFEISVLSSYHLKPSSMWPDQRRCRQFWVLILSNTNFYQGTCREERENKMLTQAQTTCKYHTDEEQNNIKIAEPEMTGLA